MVGPWGLIVVLESRKSVRYSSNATVSQQKTIKIFPYSGKQGEGFLDMFVSAIQLSLFA